MPKYVIEREVPGAGGLTAQQLQDTSQTSCSVLRKLGFEIQWIQNSVTGTVSVSTAMSITTNLPLETVDAKKLVPKDLHFVDHL